MYQHKYDKISSQYTPTTYTRTHVGGWVRVRSKIIENES